jgi:preprotein translocase subunit YajC
VQFSWLEVPRGLFVLAQEAAKQGGDGGADGAGGGLLQTIFANPILPFALIGIVFYLMLMRPEQRKRKQQQDLLSNLKKNDRVVTIGGIAGTVVNAPQGSTFVTIRVDDSNNTRLRILRTAISRVGEPEGADEESPPPESK